MSPAVKTIETGDEPGATPSSSSTRSVSVAGLPTTTVRGETTNRCPASARISACSSSPYRRSEDSIEARRCKAAPKRPLKNSAVSPSKPRLSISRVAGSLGVVDAT